MRILGVRAPGAGEALAAHVGHGVDPRMLLWRQGWTLVRLLSAFRGDDGDIVLTVQVAPRRPTSRPPKVKDRGIDPHLHVAPGEEPVKHQRLAAYAIVRSRLGLLGTQCSDQTAIPGLWQLPGGGIEDGETPSEAVVREIMEETGQRVKIGRLIDMQSDHWIGRGPTGRLEDFQALRIFYTAICPEPGAPHVLDVGGTTMASEWIPLYSWRSLPWTSGSRSVLDRHLKHVRLPRN